MREVFLEIFSVTFGLVLMFVFITGLVACASNYSCHQKAKALGYECTWQIGAGCVLEKPDGKKVLLEQLRDFD